MADKTSMEHEGYALASIHGEANWRKAMAYWLGFLRGVLASSRVEARELRPLRTEAEQFARLLRDEDAFELVRDLDTEWLNASDEISSVVQCIIDYRSRDFSLETEKDTVNEFYGFCAGIACDGVITEREVHVLLERISASGALLQDPRVKRLAYGSERAIADGVISEAESSDICNWITGLVGDSATDTGVATFGNVGLFEDHLLLKDALQFEGRIFVVTGRFQMGPRKVVENLISERGGSLKPYVTFDTNYLLVSATASRDWKHSHEGTKIIRAIELREQRDSPEFVLEPTFEAAIGLQ